jgi:uncharacterized protein YceK
MKVLAWIMTTSILCGCSTIVTLSLGDDTSDFDCRGDPFIPRIYSGIFNDVRFVKTGAEGAGFAFWDFPFSLVADTVVIPYTAVTQVKYGNICGGERAE